MILHTTTTTTKGGQTTTTITGGRNKGLIPNLQRGNLEAFSVVKETLVEKVRGN